MRHLACIPPPTCPPPAPYGNNADCEPTTLTPQADLAIQKLAAGPGGTTPNHADTPATAERIIPGQPVTFTIRITNHGPSLAQGVVLTDLLNAELSAPSLVSATPGASCGFPGVPPSLATPVSCTWQSLAVGATAEVVLTAAVADPVTATAPFANTATVDGATPEPAVDPTPNTDPAYLTTFDLAVTKVFRDGTDTTPAVAGGPVFTYTVAVVNVGTSAAVGDAAVTDTLPSGFSFAATPLDAAASTSGVTCAVPSGQTIDCTVPASLRCPPARRPR